MLQALAWAARLARGPASRRAVAELAGVSIATIGRFERAEGWPWQTEEIVAAYAALDGLRPQEVWTAALNVWVNGTGDDDA